MDEVPKRKSVSVNFGCALFSLLVIHDDLVMQGLVWLRMVQLRAIRFGMVHFGDSYVNLRQPQIFKCQILETNIILHSSKYGMLPLGFTVLLHMIFSKVKLNSKEESEYLV